MRGANGGRRQLPAACLDIGGRGEYILESGADCRTAWQSAAKYPPSLVKMTDPAAVENAVYDFVLDQIETVPHLEALLLLWNSRPQPWTVENLAKRLYVSTTIVNSLLEDLKRRGLIVCVPGSPDGFRYVPTSIGQDQLLSALDLTYRRETVRISTMIHSKPPSSVRDFARAFRFTKERE